MARRLMPVAFAIGTAGLAVLGAVLAGGTLDHVEPDETLPAVVPSEGASTDTPWFPTDAVENGKLLAIDEDGRALVGFNYSDDLRTVDEGIASWEGTFGERPGVAIVEPSGEVTVLVEPAPIDPETSEWVTADINGEMVAWAYFTYPEATDDGSPQTIWVSCGGGSPVAVQPKSADGDWVDIQSNPNIYVTDDYLVATTLSQGQGVAKVWIDDGTATILEPGIEGFLYSPWIHRDLCVEATGGEAYTFAVMTDGPGDTLGDILQQWTLTFSPDGTHSFRQIPLVTEVNLHIPTTACGDLGANALRPITGGGAIGYRTTDSYEIVQSGDLKSYTDVYLSPDYVLGVPLSPIGVVVTEIATGITTTWGNGTGCGAARLRGTFLSYPVNDESGTCRTAVVNLAIATPPDPTSAPTG